MPRVTIEDVDRDIKREGRREVVEWIRKGCACFQPDEKGEYVIPGWQAKLKEWGIE